MVRSGRRRSISAISPPAAAITVTHSSMEPSWLPQAPESLKISGLAECELLATSATERSVMANTQIRLAKARPHSKACSAAAGRTSAASSLPPSRRPKAPPSNCSAASAAASHRAARPISGIIPAYPATAVRPVPHPSLPARAACSSHHVWRAGYPPRKCHRRATGLRRPRPIPRRTDRAGCR